MDNELEKKLQQAFDKFQRNENEERLDRSHEKYYEDLAEKNSEWAYDAYMDQPAEGLVLQERVTYRRRKDGKIERECVTRTFYGNNDYQDSSSTTII